jgi:hypothetical protein
MSVCKCVFNTGGLIIHGRGCPFYVPLGLVLNEPHADLLRSVAAFDALLIAAEHARLAALVKELEDHTAGGWEWECDCGDGDACPHQDSDDAPISRKAVLALLGVA